MATDVSNLLHALGLESINPGVFCGEWIGHGPVVERPSPIDGKPVAAVRQAAAEDYEKAVARAREAFLKWRMVPAPVRGETIRRLGLLLREQCRNMRARARVPLQPALV
jgi:aldehyde dehydrogenase (NAD+)